MAIIQILKKLSLLLIIIFPIITVSQTWEELDSIAANYCDQYDYKNAIDYAEYAVETAENEFGTKNENYATALSNLALYNKFNGNYEVALSYYLKAKDIMYKVLGSSHTKYATILNDLGLLYVEIAKYKGALLFFQEAQRIDKLGLDKDPVNYIITINNIALTYSYLGDYEAAITSYTVAKDIMSKYFVEEHQIYTTIIYNLATVYNIIAKYEYALDLFEEIIEIDKNLYGENHPDYARDIVSAGLALKDIGKYNEALLLFEQATEIYKSNFGVNNDDYAWSINSLALCYLSLDENIKAIKLLNEALNIRKNIFGTDNVIYANTLYSLASAYYYNQEYEKALNLFEEAKEIRIETLGENHPAYAYVLDKIALSYYRLEDYENAISMFEKAIPILKQILGPFHFKYAQSLNNLAAIYHTEGDYLEGYELYAEANNIVNQNITTNFSYFKEAEKESYISTFNHTYGKYHSFLLDVYKTIPDYSGNGYDNELLLKGIILNSSTNINKTILGSGDSILIIMYNQFMQLKQQIIFWEQKPISKQKMDVDSLKILANSLEKELVKRSSDFSTTQQHFSISWKDIQHNLDDDEAAIEYISFRYHNGKGFTDSTLYCALLLRKDYEYPKMIYLYEQSELDNILNLNNQGKNYNEYLVDAMYNRGTDVLQSSSPMQSDNRIFQIVWEPLDRLLDGVNTIYYAPAGNLNQVSFAAIPCENGQILIDRYDLVQLSSTRELVLNGKDDFHFKPEYSVALFGGISYYSDTSQMISEALAYNSPDNKSRYVYSIDQENIEPFDSLPGTLNEVIAINKSLIQNKIQSTTIFAGEDANEESVKSFSNIKSPEVIHIATHGFFFNEQKENKYEMTDIGFEDFKKFINSNDPLQRSGLIMAGANHFWMGMNLPVNVEDGILTAKEVSALNLSNTQLVVLSACETGLGEIRGSEGVFGLQRGFKMAGVKTLIMSLWKVPDEETSQFMQMFYEEWLAGKSMRNAFRNTQHKMKSIYPNEPYLWAGFIMVD